MSVLKSDACTTEMNQTMKYNNKIMYNKKKSSVVQTCTLEVLLYIHSAAKITAHPSYVANFALIAVSSHGMYKVLGIY